MKIKCQSIISNMSDRISQRDFFPEVPNCFARRDCVVFPLSNACLFLDALYSSVMVPAADASMAGVLELVPLSYEDLRFSPERARVAVGNALLSIGNCPNRTPYSLPPIKLFFTLGSSPALWSRSVLLELSWSSTPLKLCICALLP